MEATPKPAPNDEAVVGSPWWRWLVNHELSEDQRRDVLSQLYVDRRERRRFYMRLTMLLAFSISISVLGIALDSAPVVIGAMLISPLTTPLMGLSAGLVMGWGRRAAEAAVALVVLSVFGAGLAFMTIFVIPEPQFVTLASSELLSRTGPSLLDLFVAVAAGAAGGYCLARRDAVAALPGVAIAVALVPPLSVVGMTLELGRSDLALDALLLYLTNLAGIVLAASVALLFSGLSPHPEDGRLPRRVRNGLIGAGVAVAIIAFPLFQLTRLAIDDALDRRAIERAAEDWSRNHEVELTGIELVDDLAIVNVAGPDPPPGAIGLASGIAAEVGEPVRVEVFWVRREQLRASVLE